MNENGKSFLYRDKKNGIIARSIVRLKVLLYANRERKQRLWKEFDIGHFKKSIIKNQNILYYY